MMYKVEKHSVWLSDGKQVHFEYPIRDSIECEGVIVVVLDVPAGVVRRFVVAPTPGTELESTLLVTDAGGFVRQGYVYVVDEPLLRFDAAGNVVYYLEDAMGSVVALVDGSGNKIASFNYDGFGNFRSLSGNTNAPAGIGGDFRFHGAWFEEASGLYHMRAREYDPRTGRFTSRDPRNGIPIQPETFNPYVYGVNNPYVSIDPSGELSMLELNISMSMQDWLQAFKSAAVQYARQRIQNKFTSAVSSMIQSLIGQFIPGDWASVLEQIAALPDTALDAGVQFGDIGYGILCQTIGRIPGMQDQIHRQVRVAAESGRGGLIRVGDPLTAGFHCPFSNPNQPRPEKRSVGISYGIPDFIIGDKPIRSLLLGDYNQAFIVGDFKWSLQAMYDDYARQHPRKPQQFSATIGYAQRHTFMHAALFIVVNDNGKTRLPTGKKATLVALLSKQFVSKQVVPVVIILRE